MKTKEIEALATELEDFSELSWVLNNPHNGRIGLGQVQDYHADASSLATRAAALLRKLAKATQAPQ